MITKGTCMSHCVLSIVTFFESDGYCSIECCDNLLIIILGLVIGQGIHR